METESQLTTEQLVALEALCGHRNVFLTGEAGAGKSFVIRHFRKNLNEKSFPTLASTGAAAVLVGGRTFHSFFGLGILEGGAEATLERALKDRRVVRRIQGLEGFIVDEISMLSSETLAIAERLCQMARENPAPWGGVKVIFVGDFAQLPPVTRFGQRRVWAFESEAWHRSNLVSIYLRENHRTEESEFLRALNRIRMGCVDEATKMFLNSRLSRDDEQTQYGTRLFPRLNQTDSYNLQRLEQITGPTEVFESIFSGRPSLIEKMKAVSPLPEVLTLKVGAYVMLRMNDPRGRWVNGTTGYVRKIKGDELEIELESGRMISLDKATFSMLDADGEVVAAVTNFPVSLAYAITIHKAQGLTLTQLYVDLHGLWEPGQAYVAVSRATSAKGLHVLRWSPQSFQVDPKVAKFYERLA